MSARTARTARTRLLAAAALTVATLTMTACSSAEGTRDEGAPSTSSTATESTSSSTTSGGTTTGAGQASDKGSTGTTGTTGSSGTTGSTGTSGSTNSSGTSGSTGSTGSSGSTGSDSSDDSESNLSPCTPANTRTTATVVNRPLNHVLLTVTNTGSGNCDLAYYPAVRFGEAQSVPPVIEDSQPQAVVTLAPGESGYAGVTVSAADGSGSNGYTAKTLEVYFNSESTSPARPSLPAKGVYVDDSITVTYWQSDMADALSW